MADKLTTGGVDRTRTDPTTTKDGKRTYIYSRDWCDKRATYTVIIQRDGVEVDRITMLHDPKDGGCFEVRPRSIDGVRGVRADDEPCSFEPLGVDK